MATSASFSSPLSSATHSSAGEEFRRARRAHWDGVARDRPSTWGRFYRDRLKRVYGLLIAEGSRVLEIGCARGDLLASLHPSRGVGIDLSPAMVESARERHPHLSFSVADVHELDLGGETFDFVVLSDVVNDLWDIQTALERVRPCCTRDTRLIFNVFSHLWEIPVTTAQRLRIATPTLAQNWLTVRDLQNLLELTGFDLLRHFSEIVVPVPLPGAALANRILSKIAPFRWFSMTNVVVARPAATPLETPSTVSVVVPARNEAGHIDELMARIPEMGAGTEIIFVEGHSRDDTLQAIERAIARNPGRRCRLLQQSGEGKGDAVRQGFSAATGDILMILDADLSVAPEELSRFYEASQSGRGEFVNGVRLVYPMEQQAMRFANLLGNKFFAAAFRWLLGQPVRDTLCGTKVIRRTHYERLARNRRYFGDFDPFGDFDLLFGAAKLNLRIREIPVRYHARRYGESNIRRWRHGLLLLRMVFFAARRLKFV